jgi:hypothetical protein
MANIETLKTRVENTTKKIEKLEQKLVRINKALTTGKNPYYYEERDLKFTARDIEEAKATLKKYQEQLDIEINKENAPKIQVLVDFLADWKEKATDFYRTECKACMELTDKHRAERKEWEKENGVNEYSMKFYRSELRKQQQSEMKHRFTNLVLELTYPTSETYCNEEMLEKILDREVKNKYEDLVNRISKVTGEIQDCKNLYIAGNGSINGHVIGKAAKAKVETILAGGYNIQCLHYRVLVNKI